MSGIPSLGSATAKGHRTEASEIRLARALQRFGMREASGSEWMLPLARGISQAALAEVIQVSRPTVSALVQRAEPVLVNAASGVALDPRRCGVALGVDFGEAHHRLVLADVHGSVFKPKSLGTYETEAPRGPAALSLNWAIERIPALLDEAKKTVADVWVVGVTLPGAVEAATGKLAQTPRSMDRSWEIVDMDSQLMNELALPRARIEADYNASALTEHLWGGLRDYEHAIYVKISRRCSCSLLIDHRIFRGAEGLAGRLGKTVVRHDDDTEEWVAVEDAFSLAAFESMGYPATDAAELIEASTSDTKLAAALQRGARGLGVALAPLIDAINPQAVVLGGALGAASLTWMASDLMDGILTMGRENSSRAAMSTRLKTAEFRSGTAARGAIASALLANAAERIAEAFK